QTVDKTMFKHINWLQRDDTVYDDPEDFYCAIPYIATISCEVRTIPDSEAEKYLVWASSLELLGIPQVAVKTNDEIYKMVDDDQDDIAASREPLNNSIADVNGGGTADFYDGTNRYYSAADYDDFDMNHLKKVFSEEEFNCCIPSGQQIP